MNAIIGADAPLYLVVLLEWLANFGRYAVVAGLAFLVFWVWGRERWRKRLLQRDYPAAFHVWREIGYSMSTAVIFAVSGVGLFYGARAGIFRLYLEVHTHGLPYLAFSVLLLIVLHDAYFYWTHRAMHHRLIYRHVHRVHHLSTNPSPWAAYAFAPAEALVHAAFVPLTALALPVHPIALAAFLLFMIVKNVIGHLGMELFPRGFATHPLGRWHTTATHHNLHHSRHGGHYGLYFTYWDELMGTTHRDYTGTFGLKAAAQGSAATPAEPAC